MALDNQVEVTIVLDDGSIQKGFANIQNQANKTAKGLESSFTSAFGGIKEIAAIAAGVIGGISLKKAINEAVTAENVYMRMAVSFKNAGFEIKNSTNNFIAYADKLEQSTGISSELISENASLLVSLGKLSGEGLNKATKAAVDLSKGLGVDLGTAFDMVTKASVGNTTALGKNGIKISDSIPQAEKFATVLSIIEKRFGGMAETMANATFSGTMTRLNVAIGNFFEAVGKIIIESPALRVAINGITDGIVKMSEALGEINSGGIDSFIKYLVNNLVPVLQFLSPIVEVFFRSFITGIRAVYLGIDGVIALLANITNVMVNNIIGPVMTFIANIASFYASFVSDSTAKAITDSVNNIRDSLSSVTATAAESTVDVFKDSFNSLSQAAEKTFNTDISNSFNKFLSTYQTKVNAAKAINKDLGDSITSTKDNWVSVTEIMASSTKQAFSTMIQAIGASWVKGASAFDEAKKTILGILGDMLINIGATMITTSAAVEAFKTTLTTLFGGPGLAAGLTLIALGGALKAMGGGGGLASAATGGAATGVATQPSSITSDVVNNEPAKTATQVQVVVNGNVFDSQETGLRIVDLINGAFEKQGAVLVSQA